MRYQVCTANELRKNRKLIQKIEGKNILFLCTEANSFHAVTNSCPHEGAELCQGRVRGTVVAGDMVGEYCFREDLQSLCCPWHGFEFDLSTGRSLANDQYRIKVYPVIEENGCIFVEMT